MRRHHSNSIRPGLVLTYGDRTFIIQRKAHGGKHWLCETNPGITHRVHEDKIRKMMMRLSA